MTDHSNKLPWLYLIRIRGRRLIWLALLLNCVLHNIVKGEQEALESGGQHFPSFQNRFAEMLEWRKPVSKAATLFVKQTQHKVISEVAEDIPKDGFFWGLNPNHMEAVSKVNAVLMEQESPEDWLEVASGFREQLNPHVWLRSVFSSAVHRRDLRSLRLPPVVEIIPSLFLSKEVLETLNRTAAAAAAAQRAGSEDVCLEVDENFGVDNGPENALWYFRETVMINSEHWFWHIAYPLGGSRNPQPDRNGELFYFMHHDFLARYYSDRLSAGLPPLAEWDMVVGGTIPTGYNPHLHEGNSGFEWSARPPNTPVSDIPVNNLFGAPPIAIRDRTTQKNRILDSISRGALVGRNNRPIPLDSKTGVTLLGNVIQANVYSSNPNYYGFNGMHNDGHVGIALAVDPGNLNNTAPGVMGDTSTSMRDPMFYPYHMEIDSVFRSFKNTLPPYQLNQGEWPLWFDGITVTSLKVQSRNCPVNELHTFWNRQRFDLSRGLDFARDQGSGPLLICEKILDHQDFQYELEIEQRQMRSLTNTTEVNVRLFMGPKYDLYGRRLTLEEERNLMFILDTFTAQLHGGGNIIIRPSTATPLTIPFAQSQYETELPTIRPFCGCGWPHHMLIPKGNRRGLPFHIFAIVTNANEDKVVQPVVAPDPCRTAYIYCGLMGRKYPDARPMGYPFDRKLYLSQNNNEATLEQLAEAVPNAAVAQVKIVHFDRLYGLG